MGKLMCCFALVASCFFGNKVNAQELSSNSFSYNFSRVQDFDSKVVFRQKRVSYKNINNNNSWNSRNFENRNNYFESDARNAFRYQGKRFLSDWRGVSNNNFVDLRNSPVNYDSFSDISLDSNLSRIKAQHIFYNFKTSFKLNLSGAKVETNYSLPYMLNAKIGARWNFGDTNFFSRISMPLSKTSRLSLTADSNGQYSRLIVGLNFNW